MYANRKATWEELKEPGDWIESYFHAPEGEEKKLHGVNMICRCGALISLSNTIHKISYDNDVLHIEPSVGHYDNAREGTFKCHYYIQNGEYVQA